MNAGQNQELRTKAEKLFITASHAAARCNAQCADCVYSMKIELIETEYENGISKILVSKERDFPRRHYEFIYNNVLISVQSDEIDLFDTDVLAKLTFVEYKLN